MEHSRFTATRQQASYRCFEHGNMHNQLKLFITDASGGAGGEIQVDLKEAAGTYSTMQDLSTRESIGVKMAVFHRQNVFGAGDQPPEALSLEWSAVNVGEKHVSLELGIKGAGEVPVFDCEKD
jgi:hypothetical protein